MLSSRSSSTSSEDPGLAAQDKGTPARSRVPLSYDDGLSGWGALELRNSNPRQRWCIGRSTRADRHGFIGTDRDRPDRDAHRATIGERGRHNAIDRGAGGTSRDHQDCAGLTRRAGSWVKGRRCPQIRVESGADLKGNALEVGSVLTISIDANLCRDARQGHGAYSGRYCLLYRKRLTAHSQQHGG